MTEITLSGYEMMQAVLAGGMRQIEAIRRGRKDNHGFEGDGWGVHIEGAAAEMAVAKAHAYYWNAVVRDPLSLPGDVRELQVRSTNRANGSLIVHHSDPDNALFVLVVGSIPSFRIVGGITGKAAKDERFWRTDTGRPAFFVPQNSLRQLEVA